MSWIAVIPFLGAWCAAAVTTSPDEIAMSRRFYATHFDEKAQAVPFSFVYEGQSSDALLAAWPRTFKREGLDAVRFQHTITWTDPKSGLQVRCVAVYYRDFAASEWTVYFKNTGQANTPILSDIQGLDTAFQRGDKGEFVLNGIKGDWNVAESYTPYRIELPAKAAERFAPRDSGKSSDGPRGWPYFNLQMPGKGVIIAVGWPGQWASTFTRDATTNLRVKAGQELTHLYLKPGEEIRTPLIAMMFWEGSDVVRAQNQWRRWFIAHNIPRVNGKPQPPLSFVQVAGSMEIDVPIVSKLLDAGIKLDLCWRDAMGGEPGVGTPGDVGVAGLAHPSLNLPWFPTTGGPYPQGPRGWWNSGTWDVDPEQFPNGFRPFTDWAHAHGLKFTLWFEPERVGNPNSWLAKNHPEWLLPPTGATYGVHPGNDPILDQGNPAALDWLINHVDGMIKSQGIDWYREDMNGRGPLPKWRQNDASDRQGITENHYVQGHLEFWDALRRRNPQLTGIDACASGGRRNDLESMRRAVPMCRSDFVIPRQEGSVEANQGQTYGLSMWLPYQGASVRFRDSYSYRSFYLPSFGMLVGSIEVQKKAYGECQRIQTDMLLGDYYPLTPYSLQRDQWMAWQFDRPESGEGTVQAFRRPDSPYVSARFKLRGLDPTASYKVENFDGGEEIQTGADLMEQGLAVIASTAPAALVFKYNLVK